jgi:hypothetical protein
LATPSRSPGVVLPRVNQERFLDRPIVFATYRSSICLAAASDAFDSLVSVSFRLCRVVFLPRTYYGRLSASLVLLRRKRFRFPALLASLRQLKARN